MLIATLVERRDILPKFFKSNPQNSGNQQTVGSIHFSFLATITAAASSSLQKSIQYSVINKHKVITLKDSTNSESFIHPDVIRKLTIPITKCTDHVLMASASHILFILL